jgi:hypothetical protein
MLWSICWRCWFSLVREGWHGRARFGCVHEHGLVFEEPKPERHSSDLINQMMSDEVKLLPLSLLPIGIATDPIPSSPPLDAPAKPSSPNGSSPPAQTSSTTMGRYKASEGSLYSRVLDQVVNTGPEPSEQSMGFVNTRVPWRSQIDSDGKAKYTDGLNPTSLPNRCFFRSPTSFVHEWTLAKVQ